MGLKKTVQIDEKDVVFKASAAIPRIYRLKFQRDIYKDLRNLEQAVGNADEGQSNLDLFSLEMFENIAYIMAKHAEPDKVPDSPEEWLDEFNTFSKLRKSEREMTTPLFLLRCVQLGISIRDLDLLTIGIVNDMYVESGNDSYSGWKNVRLADQHDMDVF